MGASNLQLYAAMYSNLLLSTCSLSDTLSSQMGHIAGTSNNVLANGLDNVAVYSPPFLKQMNAINLQVFAAMYLQMVAVNLQFIRYSV